MAKKKILIKNKKAKEKGSKALEELFVSKRWGDGYNAGRIAERLRVITIIEDILEKHIQDELLFKLKCKLEKDIK